MNSDLLKVIIVDDEAIFREYLMNNFDWQSIGLEVCCQANNGLDALEKALEIKPDIALVDINMPYMDGLTLSEKLMKELPKVQVVLITGYSEFEYARKAIKIGVTDYILKPFEDKELKEILLKVKANINKNLEEEKKASISTELRKEKLFNLLLNGEFDEKDEKINKEFKAVGVEFLSDSFIVATIESDNLYELLNISEEILSRKKSILNIIEEVFNRDSKHFVINGPEGKIILIIEVDEANISEKIIKERFQEICDWIEKSLQFTITVGIGKEVNGYSEIRDSYLSSLAALQNKLILGNNKVIEYKAMGKISSNFGFYSNEISEYIIMNLRANEWNNINNKLDDIFNYMLNNKLSIDYTYGICNGLVSLCLAYVMETGYEIKDIFGENFFPFSEIKKKESASSLLVWLKELFQSVLKYISKHKLNKSQKIVMEVKKYINDNFNDCNLSLEDISNKIYMNSDYLRAIFRKEEGKTINEYITHVRMQKAKELLEQGNVKLLQISDIVGYNDVSYFSKSFKKFFGMSPSEYKNLKN